MNVIADQEKVKVVEGTLTINNAEESHSGNYTCISENIAGSTNKSIQVVVSSEFTFTSFLLYNHTSSWLLVVYSIGNVRWSQNKELDSDLSVIPLVTMGSKPFPKMYFFWYVVQAWSVPEPIAGAWNDLSNRSIQNDFAPLTLFAFFKLPFCIDFPLACVK